MNTRPHNTVNGKKVPVDDLEWAELLSRETDYNTIGAEIGRRRSQAKAECRKRILAIADETAQINLAAAASAGAFSVDQLATYRAGVSWIAQTRAAWPPLAENLAADIEDDANWPQPTQDIVDLANAF